MSALLSSRLWYRSLNFEHGRVSALIANEVSSNDTLRRTAGESELLMKYDRLVAQLSSVSLESGTWRSLARERGDDIINVRALFDKSKDEYNLLEGQVAVVQ